MISDDMLAAFGPIGVKEDYSLPEQPQKTQRLPPINPRFFTPVGRGGRKQSSRRARTRRRRQRRRSGWTSRRSRTASGRADK